MQLYGDVKDWDAEDWKDVGQLAGGLAVDQLKEVRRNSLLWGTFLCPRERIAALDQRECAGVSLLSAVSLALASLGAVWSSWSLQVKREHLPALKSVVTLTKTQASALVASLKKSDGDSNSWSSSAWKDLGRNVIGLAQSE